VTAALGQAFEIATKVPFNPYVTGGYVIKFGPQQIGISLGSFECYHIVISGPAGSSFQIYIGDKFYDFVENGDINSWDPSQTMKLVYGNTVYFYWNTGTGTPVPSATMYFQESSPL
jgi:hypothetical protein